MATRVIPNERHRIEIDTTSLRLDLEIQETTTFDPREPEVRATPREVQRTKLVSAAMLALKCKQVDDRLYAAVELAAQDGSHGKRHLLAELARQLATHAPEGGTAPEVILAAAALGDPSHQLEGSLAARARRRVDEFLADPLASKPLGFYAESEELSAIFRQDRMLQTPLEAQDAPGTVEVARALHADPALRAIYERCLWLFERLTNPLVRADLRPVLTALDRGDQPQAGPCSIMPPSISHETELVQQLFSDRPIPDGFDLAQEIIERVQRGALSLVPRAESGWYDHQTWATEPLLLPLDTPEAARLHFGRAYCKQLCELWRGIVALQRETHIKQLRPVYATGMPRQPKTKTKRKVYVRPELTIEPTCEHYRRRVLSYRFVRSVVTQALGAGRLSRSITDELDAIEALCAGAYATACRDIGLAPDAAVTPDPDAAIATFSRVRDGLGDDPDLGRDARMMVPVFFDRDRGKTKVWAFLGWASAELMVGFAQPPQFQVLDPEGRPDADELEVSFIAETHQLAFAVTAEVYVTELLDRDAFRAHCDKHRTRTAILANLR